MVNISLIFAMARNRAIGLKGEIPWYIPEDFKRFKTLTLGHPCVMGRKTFDSIVKKLGKPLPGRTSIVISRGRVSYDGVAVFADIKTAIDHAKDIAVRDRKDQIFICGGAEIYKQTLPLADKLYVTEVDMDVIGDTFMPAWNDSEFRITHTESFSGDPGYSFINYERNN